MCNRIEGIVECTQIHFQLRFDKLSYWRLTRKKKLLVKRAKDKHIYNKDKIETKFYLEDYREAEQYSSPHSYPHTQIQLYDNISVKWMTQSCKSKETSLCSNKANCRDITGRNRLVYTPTNKHCIFKWHKRIHFNVKIQK